MVRKVISKRPTRTMPSTLIGPAATFPQAACPCVNATALLLLNAPNIFNASRSDAACPAFHSGTDCYDGGLGERCEQWDRDSDACGPAFDALGGSISPPAWCSKPWCYVDAANCNRPSSPATYLFRGQQISPSASLAFSYETCGSRNLYGVSVLSTLERTLRNMTIRAGIVTRGSNTAYTANIFPQDSATGQFSSQGDHVGGALMDLHDFMVSRYGVNIEFHDIAQSSIEQVRIDRGSDLNSTWWGCIYEVAINATDMCFGDVWVFATRTAMLAPHASFSIGLMQTQYSLITHVRTSVEGGGKSFGEMLGVPLKPFTGRLWAVVVAAFVAHALAYWAAEYVAARTRGRAEIANSRSKAERSKGKEVKHAVDAEREVQLDGDGELMEPAGQDSIAVKVVLDDKTSHPGTSRRSRLIRSVSGIVNPMSEEERSAHAAAVATVDPQARPAFI